MSLWDSLFAFFRYYSTAFIATRFFHVTTARVCTKFSFYAIPYCVLFIVAIHCYYYLYIFILISHCAFNHYCTWKYSVLLIDSYQQSTGSLSPEIHRKMLSGVYLMRRIQLINCALSTVSVGCVLMFVCDLAIVMDYIPILWCVYCGLFTLNFVRNRHCLYRTLFTVYQSLKFSHLHCCVRRTQNEAKFISEIEPKMAAKSAKAHLQLRDTKSAPMIPSNIDTTQTYTDTDTGHSKVSLTPNSRVTPSKTPNNVTPKHRQTTLSGSAPTSPNIENKRVSFAGACKAVTDSEKCTVIGTVENESEMVFIDDDKFDNDSPLPLPPMGYTHNTEPTMPHYTARLVLSESHSETATNVFEKMSKVRPGKLERGSTDPLSNHYGFIKEEQSMSDEQLLQDLSMTKVIKMRQMQRNKFRLQTQPETHLKLIDSNGNINITNNNPLIVDQCWDVLISQGFADKQHLKSIQQLRQFKNNQKKIPKHLMMWDCHVRSAFFCLLYL